jgi:hypothetical protein
MSNPPHVSSTAKFAWREIPRTDSPKRAAAERVADFFEIYSNLDEASARAQAER